MSGQLRSKQGCWTCRLRKKKCDEGHPSCSKCESLSITCYGYGSKPDWMHNDETIKAIAQNLKEVVKHTSRRKTVAQLSTQGNQVTIIAPKPLPNASTEISAIDLAAGSYQNSSPEHDVHVTASSLFSISPNESDLIMNFLDEVFPLQYPMYKPTVLNGGRGWLLTHLLLAKPFYHAALALSAYHRRTTTLENLSHSCQLEALVQQEKYLELSIKTINEHAQNSCPNSGPAVIISVVEMMFFELFTDNSKSWQAHLGAAVGMYQQGHRKDLPHFGLTEDSRNMVFEDLALTKYEAVVKEQVAAFRFQESTVIWLDIISSITAGTSPQLSPFHFSVISRNSQTKLSDIMGCNNWVMLQLGRIAALHEDKPQILEHGNLDFSQFQQNSDDITRELQYCINQATLAELNPCNRDASEVDDASNGPTVVTHYFATMAVVYLHLVSRGFERLGALDTIISGDVEMLRTRTPKHLLPALTCPLFFLGCVSKEENKELFRNIFSTLPLLNPVLKHRRLILPVLDEIWRRRELSSNFSWADTLKITKDILLI